MALEKNREHFLNKKEDKQKRFRFKRGKRNLVKLCKNEVVAYVETKHDKTS